METFLVAGFLARVFGATGAEPSCPSETLALAAGLRGAVRRAGLGGVGGWGEPVALKSSVAMGLLLSLRFEEDKGTEARQRQALFSKDFSHGMKLGMPGYLRYRRGDMKPFLTRWFVTTLAVLAASTLLKGISHDHALSLLAASLFLGIANALVRPVLLLLSIPLILLTMGLFILVINAFLLYTVGQIVPGFHVESFGSAFVGAILVSIVSWLVSAFFRSSDGRVHVLTHHQQMKRVEGRVIDV
jgi:putative membrane protein